jgi:flagellar motor switch protein FliG
MDHSLVGLDGGQYMQNVLSKTHGDEKASEMMQDFLLHSSAEGLEAIRVMEPRTISNIIRREHPQVIAFVLASLDPDRASQVLDFIPENLQGEILYRISTMEEIHPNVVNELEEAVKNHVSRNASGAISNVGGLKFAAEVLNRTDRTKEQRILDDIKAIEEPVYQKIEEQLFVFEDIVQLDDRTLQSILKEVTTDVLVVALRATDQRVQDKFFGNMSTRAADIIKEEMEMRGPVRLKEVEQAQQDLIAVAKGLEQAGKITLGKGGEDVYV